MMRVAATQATGELQAFKARFFKALAHPVRVRLVELLVERNRSVQELQSVWHSISRAFPSTSGCCVRITW